MIRDPLYRKIEERLGERLDPHLFERCALELLRDAYPGLAPVTGGGDAGMDGAIPNEAGDRLPLIVTTAERVLANLTRSLESYGRAGGSATEVVVATSQALTPHRQRNLEARAGELGFTLLNIHDRADFTGRLYRNPAWRSELLGLRGNPPALSALPPLTGPHPAGPLLGRDEELDRLRAHRGDGLLVGQPGVGKTALLTQLAGEGRGLFVVSEDRGQIADAFREGPVHLLFVDDAHFRQPLLDLLLRLRDEPGFDFGIVASTWPSHEQALAVRLFVGRDRLIQVGGLPRETVAEIICREEPDLADGVISEILDQSEDPPDDILRHSGPCRPGLALTLARYTAQRGLEDLVRGNLLLEGLRQDFRQLSDTGLHYLAVLAMGGSAGMQLSSAARAVGLPEATMSGSLAPLSGTGTLTDTYRRAIVIRPAALRHALVARTYFSGGLRLCIEPALEAVEDAVACTETLLGALARGAPVPHERLQDRLDAHKDAGVGSRVLDLYAATGAEGAMWVLDRHHDRASSVASTALRLAPEWGLRRLLVLAMASDDKPPEEHGELEIKPGDRSPPTVEREDLLSAVGTWVRAGRPATSAFMRRQALLSALTELGQTARGRPKVMANLVGACFSLGFMAIEGDSVSREKFRMPMGSLTAEDVAQLAALWPDAMRILPDLGDPGMACVQGVIHEWATGVRIAGKRPETKVASRAEVSRLLQQALEVQAWREPGFLHWARGIAREHALDVTIPEMGDVALNQWIDVLYPRASVDRDTRRQMTSVRKLAETRLRLQRGKAAALRLAGEWCREKPETVVDRMLVLKRQGKLSGRRGTRSLDLIAVQLAEMVDDPSAWLDTFASRPAPEAWIGPFVATAVAADPSGEAPWRTLERFDGHGAGTWAGLQVGLYLRDPPCVAVQHVMAAVRENAGVLRDAVHWSDVPDEWRIRLLKDRDETVRGETAAALWDLHDRKPPPGDLGVAWRDAAVTCGAPELLHDVLREDAAAAAAWLIHEAEESARRKNERPERADEIIKETGSLGRTVWHMLGESFYSLDTELLAVACAALGPADRQRLRRVIPADTDPRFLGSLRSAGEHGQGGSDLEHDA